MPSRASISLKQASTDSPLAHVQHHAAPRNARRARASSMPRAPASLVAVPTTRAPRRPSSSAIARPMPREAPVTTAIHARSWVGSGMVFLPAGGQRRGQAVRILHRQHGEVGPSLDATVERREDLARPALDDRRDPARQHGPHGVGPAHRLVELFRRARGGCRPDSRASARPPCTRRARPACAGPPRQPLREPCVPRPTIRRLCEGTLTGSGHGALRAARLGGLDGARHGRRIARRSPPGPAR